MSIASIAPAPTPNQRRRPASQTRFSNVPILDGLDRRLLKRLAANSAGLSVPVLLRYDRGEGRRVGHASGFRVGDLAGKPALFADVILDAPAGAEIEGLTHRTVERVGADPAKARIAGVTFGPSLDAAPADDESAPIVEVIRYRSDAPVSGWGEGGSNRSALLKEKARLEQEVAALVNQNKRLADRTAQIGASVAADKPKPSAPRPALEVDFWRHRPTQTEEAPRPVHYGSSQPAQTRRPVRREDLLPYEIQSVFARAGETGRTFKEAMVELYGYRGTT